MMPEPLLNELEQTAKDAGIRVALIAAYHQGRAEELKAWAESIERIASDACKTSESSSRTDESGVRNSSPAIAMQVEQAGSKFTPLAYNADWVSQDGD